MQDTIYSTSTCTDEQGRTRVYHYSLITEHIPVGRFSFESYGVKVEEEGGDCVLLPGLTHNRSRIETLLELLTQHAVSPTHVVDVVEDWAKENHLPRPVSRQVVDVG